MRACVSACEVHTPGHLDEALELLASEPEEWKPLAGGTDLMVVFSAGKLPNRRFMNIWRLQELRGIFIDDNTITLGALTTYSDVLHHRDLCKAVPLLTAAAAQTGGVATQNRGTLGGNIINASPAADTPPVFLVYDAEVELTSIRGSRWTPYSGFHTAYRQTLMAADELLTRIRLPRPTTHLQSQFRKVAPRKAQAISKVCFAAIRDQENLRIAYGSVAPVPLRCFRTEAAIRNGHNPLEVLASELAPIDDIRSTATYRLHVAQRLLAGFLANEC